jgi:iron-sulfur cluster repair protein YtfE (RIC family)
MNAVELLKMDHRRVESLFGHLNQAKEPGQTKEMVDVLIAELAKHAAVEEMIFYPAVKDMLPKDGEHLVDEGLEEHMEVKKLLVKLDDLKPGDAELEQTLEQLKKAVEHHVHEEESDMMAKVEQAVDAETLELIGEELDKAKRIAPTRAHPHAPTEPPALTAAAPLAAVLDKIRDKLQRRKQL